MESFMESEMKYLLSPTEYEVVRSRLYSTLGTPTVVEGDCYFLDTLDGTLAKHDVVARLVCRQPEDATWTLGLKVPHASHNGILARRELRVILSEDQSRLLVVGNVLSTDELPQEFRAVLASYGIGQLVNLGSMHTRRETWTYLDAAKIALDMNAYLGVQDFELELEALSPGEDLHRIYRKLLSPGFGRLNMRSKHARFVAVLIGNCAEHDAPHVKSTLARLQG